jgi:hypothetical protein
MLVEYTLNFKTLETHLIVVAFHFSQKCWGKYVAMTTMICVKHFMNIVDIFINSCLKNNLRKKTLNFKTLETHLIVVAMATYFPPRFL